MIQIVNNYLKNILEGVSNWTFSIRFREAARRRAQAEEFLIYPIVFPLVQNSLQLVNDM